MTSPLAAAGKPRSVARLAVSRWLVLASLVACHDRGSRIAPAEPPPHERELRLLFAFETERRAATDFATLPPSDVAFGPDPYRIAALGGGDRLIGLLRGESAVVLLDRDGAELARVAAPRSPSGLAVSGEGDVLVVGEAARELAQLRVTGDRLVRVATLPVDALGMRDVALAPDGRTAYIVEDRTGRLLAVSLEREQRALRATGVRELGRCHGPIQVEAIAGAVAVDCLLDHTIEIRRDGAEVARIHHDGPLWRFALHRETDGGLLIAAGGVEDHPLVREDGGFGYIDSYLTLYRFAPGAAQPVRLAAVNTSALGAVTPKWVAFRAAEPGAVSVSVAGYASATLLTLTWRDLAAEPEVAQAPLLPGTAAAQILDDGAIVAANPLFDAWIVARGEPRVVAVPGARPRALPSRIGELLFFTTMMAPWNSAEGKLSRFTCETCHHEGYVDGRTHFTGRGKVYATTRPLLGLFNNRPHFSRALDKTMAQMVHAEFRVANRHNGRDPWFALTRAEIPWLDRVADAPPQLSPQALREALMSFLMDFTHRANPAAIDHARFTERERAGAQVFRDRCAGCHAARLAADQPGSLVPFERWESLVLSASGPIVWSNAAYARTGVEPYVHPDGARVPALRRLYKKWPYFTSGTARSLSDVLDRFAGSGDAGYHDAAPAAAARLGADDKAALLAFLDLL
jgi:Cytochrome c